MAKKPSVLRRGRSLPSRREADPSLVRHAVRSLDAEDIAMDRLQANLRKTETIQEPTRARSTVLARTTVHLPSEMLQRLRDRARRAGLSVSEVVEAALAQYLKAS